jgi:hypothetical protein
MVILAGIADVTITKVVNVTIIEPFSTIMALGVMLIQAGIANSFVSINFSQ